MSASRSWAIQTHTSIGLGFGLGLRSIGRIGLDLFDLENSVRYEGRIISLNFGLGTPWTLDMGIGTPTTFRTNYINHYDFDRVIVDIGAGNLNFAAGWGWGWAHFNGIGQDPFALYIGGVSLGLDAGASVSLGMCFLDDMPFPFSQLPSNDPIQY